MIVVMRMGKINGCCCFPVTVLMVVWLIRMYSREYMETKERRVQSWMTESGRIHIEEMKELVLVVDENEQFAKKCCHWIGKKYMAESVLPQDAMKVLTQDTQQNVHLVLADKDCGITFFDEVVKRGIPLILMSGDGLNEAEQGMAKDVLMKPFVESVCMTRVQVCLFCFFLKMVSKHTSLHKHRQLWSCSSPVSRTRYINVI